MLRPSILNDTCQSCNPCQARLACKTRAIIKIDPDEPPYIAVERCSGCGACVLGCGYQAIIMVHSGAGVGGGCRGVKISAGK